MVTLSTLYERRRRFKLGKNYKRPSNWEWEHQHGQLCGNGNPFRNIMFSPMATDGCPFIVALDRAYSRHESLDLAIERRDAIEAAIARRLATDA